MQNRRKPKLSEEEEAFDYEDDQSNSKKKFSTWQIVLLVIAGTFVMITLFLEENIRKNGLTEVQEDYSTPVNLVGLEGDVDTSTVVDQVQIQVDLHVQSSPISLNHTSTKLITKTASVSSDELWHLALGAAVPRGDVCKTVIHSFLSMLI